MVLDSHTMSTTDALGFGTLISLDGGSADPGALADEELTRRVVAELVAAVEGDLRFGPDAVVLQDYGADGHSAAMVAGETSVSLHAFAQLRSVTLQFFSVRDLPLSRTTKLFLEAYLVGRFQSSVRGRGPLLPRDRGSLERVLAGDRAYSRLRVAPTERVTL